MMVINEKFFLLLSPLVDDVIARQIKIAWKEYDENEYIHNDSSQIALQIKESYEMSKVILNNKVSLMLFHDEVKSRDLHTLFSSVTPETLRFYTGDFNKLYDELDWFLSHKKLWRSKIESRELDHYKNFAAYVTELESRIRILNMQVDLVSLGLSPLDNLSKRLKDSKSLFYRNNEKSRSTGLFSLTNRVRDLELLLHGVKFIKHVKLDEQFISVSRLRQF